MSYIDDLVDGLNELLIQRRDLKLLLRRLAHYGCDVDTMYPFVVANQGLYRVGCELKGHFVSKYHIHVYNMLNRDPGWDPDSENGA